MNNEELMTKICQLYMFEGLAKVNPNMIKSRSVMEYANIIRKITDGIEKDKLMQTLQERGHLKDVIDYLNFAYTVWLSKEIEDLGEFRGVEDMYERMIANNVKKAKARLQEYKIKNNDADEDALRET